MRVTSLREDTEFYTPLTLGPAHLFFGNRAPNVDFLYEDELAAYVARGVLTRLHTAFSRVEPGRKVYVQHRMQEVAPALADLIVNKGAYVYVCGDGAHMAKDVHSALVSVLREHGGAGVSSEADAAEMLVAMAKRGRYVRDIWS
jgi:NADPH-ferrihemoprotein reductase